MGPFRTYEIFQCQKMHWNSNYDFVKYKGKAKNLTNITFARCSERWFYEALNERYKAETEFVLFLIPCFLENANMSFNEFLSEQTRELADDWAKRIRSIKKAFYDDSVKVFSAIMNNRIDFGYFFTSNLIFEFLIDKKISIESFIIFDRLIYFLDKTGKDNYNVIYDVIYEQRVRNYSSFISVDLSVYRDVFEKALKEVKKEMNIQSKVLGGTK